MQSTARVKRGMRHEEYGITTNIDNVYGYLIVGITAPAHTTKSVTTGIIPSDGVRR